MGKLDPELQKKYAIKWNCNLIEVKSLPGFVAKDGKEFKKAEVLLLPEGWTIENALKFQCFGWSAEEFLRQEVRQGDLFEISWLPEQYTSKAGYLNCQFNILSAKKLVEVVEEVTQEQKIDAAVKMIDPGTTITQPKSTKVQESDFDFNSGEIVPF